MSKTPDFLILYTQEGLDITADLRPDLIALRLTDNLEGEADTLTVELSNTTGKWFDTWLPDEGDIITASIGYKGEQLLGPISFEVDKVAWRGEPDTFSIGAIATPITKALRAENNTAYEDTTLREIAQAIADKHGLELSGEIPDISFERVTNKGQTDLNFLRDLSADYGCIFKVDSLNTLVFYREIDLEAQEASLTLSKLSDDADIPFSRYQLSRENAGTYKQAKISYQDATKEFIEVTVDLGGEVVPEPAEDEEGTIASEDVLRIEERVESLAVARVRAEETLRRANRSRVTLSATLPGDTRLNAGTVVNVEGFSRLSGRYLISKATHSIRPAYTTQIEARKV